MAEMNNTNRGTDVPLSLKAMSSDDVFGIVAIISKLGLTGADIDSDLLKKATFQTPKMMKNGKVVPLPRNKWTAKQKKLEEDSAMAQSQVAMVILQKVLESIPDCKDSIYGLLASATGTDVKTIESLSAIDLVKEIDAYIDRQEFFDFFSQALQLLGDTTVRLFSVGFSGDTTTPRV